MRGEFQAAAAAAQREVAGWPCSKAGRPPPPTFFSLPSARWQPPSLIHMPSSLLCVSCSRASCGAAGTGESGGGCCMAHAPRPQPSTQAPPKNGNRNPPLLQGGPARACSRRSPSLRAAGSTTGCAAAAAAVPFFFFCSEARTTWPFSRRKAACGQGAATAARGCSPVAGATFNPHPACHHLLFLLLLRRDILQVAVVLAAALAAVRLGIVFIAVLCVSRFRHLLYRHGLMLRCDLRSHLALGPPQAARLPRTESPVVKMGTRMVIALGI